MSELRRYLLPGLCVLALILALHTMTLASAPPASLPVESVEIVTAGGETHAFEAYLADTPEARGRGLMWVTRLESRQGMLFDFEEPRRVGMWMKNTPLSLDMLFIDEHGVIVHIERRTRPYSRNVIDSGTVVRAVLEINGGLSSQLGIAPGDRVVHRLFPATR